MSVWREGPKRLAAVFALVTGFGWMTLYLLVLPAKGSLLAVYCWNILLAALWMLFSNASRWLVGGGKDNGIGNLSYWVNWSRSEVRYVSVIWSHPTNIISRHWTA